ncbi:MAG: transposase [Akkermansiaceae bacterium]
MPFTPYKGDESVHRHRLNLPHWRQWGRTYFITTRLADSVPGPVLDRWREQRALWLTHHGLPPDGVPDDLPKTERIAFHREFTARFHELLDAGHGECLLARPPIAEILATQLKSGHGTNYQIDAWVIMPNHIHALVEPLEKHTLGSILQRWKGASARLINQALGRSGSLWQAETFDHIVCSEAQLDHYRRYIVGNPGKASLKDGFVLGRGNVVEDFSPSSDSERTD